VTAGVFVVGMHRSGTSAVVRVLESIGFFAGAETDFHPPTAHDPLGHREHIMVWRANETALTALGRGWDDPVGINWDLLPGAARGEVTAAIDLAVAQLDEHRLWVAKDPRLCLTLPLWRRATTPLCVMTHRNPMDVARSLAARDGMPVFGGLALWEWYQRSALNGSAGLVRVYVSFADLAADPERFSARLLQLLHESAPDLAFAGASMPTVFDPNLVREQSVGNEVQDWLNPTQRSLFDALEQATAGSPGADDAVAAALAAPMSAQATEILATLARHRCRQAETERRDHEISQWNEHLQRQLDARPPLS
jgi:hypothetical protein